jgi:hypothetical protein
MIFFVDAGAKSINIWVRIIQTGQQQISQLESTELKQKGQICTGGGSFFRHHSSSLACIN